MKIDWAALGTVAVVSITATVLFVILLATSIRLLSAARIKANQGQSATVTLSVGYTALALAGFLVLFGIWLIVPQVH